MAISENKIYPRTGDAQTVHLKNVITNENIKIGDYTMYNDFARDPRDFEKNNVLYHYPVNGDQLQIGNDVWSGFGGVPAKPIRKRFSDDVISELLKIQWWNWPENRIQKNIAAIQSGRIEDLE